MIIFNHFLIFIKFFIFLSILLITVKMKKDESENKIKKEKNENNITNINESIHSLINYINNNYVDNNSDIPIEVERRKNQELEDINRYNLLLNPNASLIEKERRTILNFYFPSNQNRTNITIFFDMEFPFGNQIAAFNKLIFYCEIIKCKKILLNRDNKMYINHTLYDKDYNMTIEIVKNEIPFDDWLTTLSPNFFYDFYRLKIENRLDIIKNEIINNLPKIEINKTDLIIHFRSSDVFQHKNDPEHAPDYAQPPLCFYETILQKFNFENIYLISIDDIYNPVIKELKTKYPKIIYHENSLEVDISYLVRGNNIVGSISSFLVSCIKLNDNLKYFWEYDRYPMCSKMFHSHPSIFNFKRNYTTYLMEPSETYKNKMIIWKCTDEQIEIMLKDQCPNDFKIIPPDISNNISNNKSNNISNSNNDKFIFKLTGFENLIFVLYLILLI